MARLTSLTVAGLLDALGSTEPLPAGGSAAALAAAAGVSLLLKVAALPVRNQDPAHTAARAAMAARLRPVRDRLLALIDGDAEAYARVLTALRLPTETAEDASRRREAVAAAMREATGPPLATLRACSEALEEAAGVAGHGPRSTVADVEAAIELLQAAVRSAGGFVDSNLGALSDERFAGGVRSECERLDAGRARAIARALSAIEQRRRDRRTVSPW